MAAFPECLPASPGEASFPAFLNAEPYPYWASEFGHSPFPISPPFHFRQTRSSLNFSLQILSSWGILIARCSLSTSAFFPRPPRHLLLGLLLCLQLYWPYETGSTHRLKAHKARTVPFSPGALKNLSERCASPEETPHTHSPGCGRPNLEPRKLSLSGHRRRGGGFDFPGGWVKDKTPRCPPSHRWRGSHGIWRQPQVS